jgi:hypothetical protein
VQMTRDVSSCDDRLQSMYCFSQLSVILRITTILIQWVAITIVDGILNAMSKIDMNTSIHPPGFVSDRTWKAEQLDGKHLRWQLVHKGNMLPPVESFAEGALSAKAHGNGIIVNVIFSPKNPNSNPKVQPLAQWQVDSLVETPDGFSLS